MIVAYVKASLRQAERLDPCTLRRDVGNSAAPPILALIIGEW